MRVDWGIPGVMRISLKKLSELAGEEIRQWDHLLEHATPYTSPFLSHAFCRAVDEVCGNVKVLQFETPDRIAGFLPFQLRKGRSLLGHAQKVGAEMSDCFGAIGMSGVQFGPEEILNAARISSLRFDHGNSEMCPFQFSEREEQKGLRVHATGHANFIDGLKAADKHFVKTVSRAEAALASTLGPISFRWNTDNPFRDLSHLISVKRQQFRRTNKPDNLRKGWQSALLQRLVCRPEGRNCEPILSTLYGGQTWLASNLSLRCGNVLHIWFPAYNVNYRRYSPGHLLFFKLIGAGLDRGLTFFDFGEGEAAYKKKYRGESYSLWKGAIARKSLSGFSEGILQSLEWRIDKAMHGRRGKIADASI